MCPFFFPFQKHFIRNITRRAGHIFLHFCILKGNLLPSRFDQGISMNILKFPFDFSSLPAKKLKGNECRKSPFRILFCGDFVALTARSTALAILHLELKRYDPCTIYNLYRVRNVSEALNIERLGIMGYVMTF